MPSKRAPGDRQKIDAPRFSPGQLGGGFFQVKRGAEIVVHAAVYQAGADSDTVARLRSTGQRIPPCFF
jgi:hypothetical protein